jgi:hypothetical protein
MTNIAEVVEAFAQKERMDEFAESDHLTLGELAAILEGIGGDKPVLFGDGFHCPSGIGSWRGSYRETALRYQEADDETVSTCEEFAATVRNAIGNAFRGYKGGEFTMNNATPVWVANRGDTNGFLETDTPLGHQGVVGVEELEDSIVIETTGVKF